MAKAKIPSVRGVRDILPAEARRWVEVERKARETFARYGYGEIRIPIFERTALFSRGIGEATEIVSKEMYTFTDKGGDSITLRPEATASVCRAYIENGLYNAPGVTKLFCIGPMFRYERPQAGRLRQFHQINVEAFGSDDPALDAEVIAMLMEFLAGLGLEELKIQINNLGTAGTRRAYGAALRDYLRGETRSLGPEIGERIEKNPLRFLDSKDPAHRDILARAPAIDRFWDEDCRAHFQATRALLERLGIPFEHNPRLVRGLDYYCLTVFEVTSGRLGAQNAVCGGGRYDQLIEELGGPPTPGVGFAVGIERLIQLIGEGTGAAEAEGSPATLDVFLVPLGEAARAEALALAAELREAGIRSDISFGGGSAKSQMRRAGRSGARYVVLIGEEEMAKGVVAIRDMREGKQEECARDRAAGEIARRVGG